MFRSARRGAIALAVVLVVLAGVAVGARVLFGRVQDVLVSDSCSVGVFDIDPAKAAVASQMVGVVLRRELPERAAVLTLAAALQESKLRNIPAGMGDRDSVGVLQQRPSQGWGTAEQLADVRYATGVFLDALVKVPNWQTDTLADVIQSVQVSADSTAYAQHEPEAQALADALTGARPAGITCTFRPPSQVAAASTVAAQLAGDLPVRAPSVNGQAVSAPGAGWPTAAWFVANADRLGIEKVAYAGRTWSRTHGWQPSTAADAAVTATMYSS